MDNVMQFVFIIIIVLLSLSLHECAHAFVSYKLGDPTAKNLGRLTLNPFKHLDILGTIMMVATLISGSGFGWAKPVPINPMYYKNQKRGTMLVSIAGPLSNLLLAFISTFPILYIIGKYDTTILSASDPKIMLVNFFKMFFYTNINLAIFNLLPIPPLDGSKILSGILPTRQYYKFMEYENYIGVAFLLIIFIFPNQFSAVLKTITTPVRSLLVDIASPIVGMFL